MQLASQEQGAKPRGARPSNCCCRAQACGQGGEEVTAAQGVRGQVAPDTTWPSHRPSSQVRQWRRRKGSGRAV